VFSVEVNPHDRKGRVANVDAGDSCAQDAKYSGFGDARQLSCPRGSSLRAFSGTLKNPPRNGKIAEARRRFAGREHPQP
jgi:hypothetical protein